MKSILALSVLLAGLGMLAGCNQHPNSKEHWASAKTSAHEQLPSLDGLIRFFDPKECQFSEPMARLFGSLIHPNPDYTISAGRPDIPRAFAAAFGKPTSKTGSDHLLTVTVPVRGTWKGLRVVAIASSAMPESDVGWDTIRFAAPKQIVMRKLNEEGMELPPSGKRRHADPEEPMEFAAVLFEDGAVTQLDCN